MTHIPEVAQNINQTLNSKEVDKPYQGYTVIYNDKIYPLLGIIIDTFVTELWPYRVLDLCHNFVSAQYFENKKERI